MAMHNDLSKILTWRQKGFPYLDKIATILLCERNTRAALNPGLCNEVDKRLHEWASRNDQGIAAIIAGHTHRAVFENLSLTERRYLESKVKTDGIKIKNQPDGSYYNTGSCVHQLCITGIEITFENGPRLRLIKWGQATEGYALTIQRTVLEET
jgi:hypothetical protein